MIFEHPHGLPPDELPDETSDFFDLELEPEEDIWHSPSQKMHLLDLGPSDYRFDRNLGPDTEQEEEAFQDADDPRYIDSRPSTGTHCMDDRGFRAGMQLPGGLLETAIVSRYMNPQLPPWTVRESYERLIPSTLTEGVNIWAHGDSCAAAVLKREALRITGQYPSSAFDFTHDIMTALKLRPHESDIYRAIYTGVERAEKNRLWDTSFSGGLELIRGNPRINYEEFSQGHRAAGLRIDATENLFNNELFRQEHVIDGEEVGLLSVTLGAYKKFLENRGCEPAKVNTALMHATLFTYGLAKAAGHQYLRTGIIVPFN